MARPVWSERKGPSKAGPQPPDSYEYRVVHTEYDYATREEKIVLPADEKIVAVLL